MMNLICPLISINQYTHLPHTTQLPVYMGSVKKVAVSVSVIPVQERHLPEDTRNPIFELAYFRYGLLIAAKWAYELGFTDEASQWHNIECI